MQFISNAAAADTTTTTHPQRGKYSKSPKFAVFGGKEKTAKMQFPRYSEDREFRGITVEGLRNSEYSCLTIKTFLWLPISLLKIATLVLIFGFQVFKSIYLPLSKSIFLDITTTKCQTLYIQKLLMNVNLTLCTYIK